MKPITIAAADLLKKEFPPRQHLIKPFLRQGEAAMIYAPTGTGKSMLTLTLAMAIAGGGEVLNFECSKGWRVLYVDGEMLIEDVKDRMQVLKPTIKDLDEKLMGTNLTLMSRSQQPYHIDFPDISNQNGIDEFFELLYDKDTKKPQYDLVILDNLSTLALEIDDENSAANFNYIIKFFARLKQHNIASILVHHTNKTGKSYRGSSKLPVALEVVMRLDEWKDGTPYPSFKVNWEKYRHLKDESITDRNIHLTINPFENQWEYVGDGDALKDKILQAIFSHKCTNQDEIAKAVGTSQGTVSKTLKKIFADPDYDLDEDSYDENMQFARTTGEQSTFEIAQDTDEAAEF